VKVLVACEFSGVVRDAFITLGVPAISCDLYPTISPGPHIKGDIRSVLDGSLDLSPFGFDISDIKLMICHPPCTHLACSGAKHFWYKKELQAEALDFVRLLLNAKVGRIALENPVGVISSQIRKPDQLIHPWQFGESYEKTTCLWLKHLPKLQPTKIVDKGDFVYVGKGKTKLPKEYSDNTDPCCRSVTFRGIAAAMAKQWSPLI
jgi:hypothetical protein